MPLDEALVTPLDDAAGADEVVAPVPLLGLVLLDIDEDAAGEAELEVVPVVPAVDEVEAPPVVLLGCCHTI